MGADLLIARLVIDKNKEPDFAAGHAHLDSLEDEKISEAYETAYGDVLWIDHQPDAGMEIPDVAKMRTEAHELVDELAALIGDAEDTYDRTLMVDEIRGATVYMTGGMSWGDDPTEAWTLFTNLDHFQGVLGAIGFE